MSVAQTLTTVANSLRTKLDAINAAFANKGQSAAATYDDVPAKIDELSNVKFGRGVVDSSHGKMLSFSSLSGLASMEQIISITIVAERPVQYTSGDISSIVNVEYVNDSLESVYQHTELAAGNVYYTVTNSTSLSFSIANESLTITGDNYLRFNSNSGYSYCIVYV